MVYYSHSKVYEPAFVEHNDTRLGEVRVDCDWNYFYVTPKMYMSLFVLASVPYYAKENMFQKQELSYSS
jgi:hypothetical protein